MGRLVAVSFTIALFALNGVAFAGQIWTDGNGDGLPDTDPIAATPSTNVTIGVWIDAQSFNWTNYLAYVEWTNCFSYVSATYVITGGLNFPIDVFSLPRAIGFGGTGFNEGGVDHIGNYVLHVNMPIGCCVTPMIDIYNPYYIFSQLGAGSSYMLFTSNPGTCYGAQEPSGACCYVDGSCDVQFALDCQAGGGVYQGDGTNCAEANCQPLTQACCINPCTGECLDLLPEDCVAQNGAPQGPGTSCSMQLCLPAPCVGACCLPDGSCFDVFESICASLGGVYQGDAVPCSTVQCEQPGACCFPDETCQVLMVAECAASGGAYQGDNTTCTPGLCDLPDPTEACCMAFSDCVDLPADSCRARQGVPQGPGTSCAGGGCSPQLVAPCCLQDGSCIELTEAECAAVGGGWIGGGTCGVTDCITAVESKSWGGVKARFR